MLEVRRDDGELCGYVATEDGQWRSLTTFGARLSEHESEHDAREHVATVGLQVLADRWTLVDRSNGNEQVVCIQQVTPSEITLALDYYAMPGVPTKRIAIDELTAGRWLLKHRA